MQHDRGKIKASIPYLFDKMLDHSGWSEILPRNVTPSDVDFFFDANGTIVFCELSRQHDDWRNVPDGQSRSYAAFVRNNHRQHVSVLVYHAVRPTTASGAMSPHNIRTWHTDDIRSFQLMFGNGRDVLLSERFDSQHWPNFIREIFRCEDVARAIMAIRPPDRPPE